MPSSRGFSKSRDWTQGSRIAGRFFTNWATMEAQEYWVKSLSLLQEIFPTQEQNWGLLHCRQILYQLNYKTNQGWVGARNCLHIWSAHMGFPDGSAGKESACSVGDLDSIPGLGRSPGERNRYPLHYSGLENSMNCIVDRVTKSWTWLSSFQFHFSWSTYCHFSFHNWYFPV